MKVTYMLVAAALATVAMAPAAFADSGKGKGGTGGTTGTASVTDTRLVAKLTPMNGQDSMFEGHVASRVNGTARAEFEARVEVPVTMFTGDPPDHLTLMLPNGVQCMMVFNEIDQVSNVAEFKLSIRSRNGVPVNRAGSCGVVGAPPTIPVVHDRESAMVTVGADTLQGVFAAKR
jgi:hypothetical protein